jgi:hypothetical protein
LPAPASVLSFEPPAFCPVAAVQERIAVQSNIANVCLVAIFTFIEEASVVPAQWACYEIALSAISWDLSNHIKSPFLVKSNAERRPGISTI